MTRTVGRVRATAEQRRRWVGLYLAARQARWGRSGEAVAAVLERIRREAGGVCVSATSLHRWARAAQAELQLVGYGRVTYPRDEQERADLVLLAGLGLAVAERDHYGVECWRVWHAARRNGRPISSAQLRAILERWIVAPCMETAGE